VYIFISKFTLELLTQIFTYPHRMFPDLPSHGTTQSILLVYPILGIPIYSIGHERYYHGMAFGNCRSRRKDISNIAIPKGSQITF